MTEPVNEIMPDSPVFSAQDSLVAVMIAVAAADEDIRTVELIQITIIVNNLPVFADYDASNLSRISQIVFDLFEQEDGLDALFGLIRESLPTRLYETAYAMACDVAASDGAIAGPEARMLEEIRDELSIDRLPAAAIERGARARYMTL